MHLEAAAFSIKNKTHFRTFVPPWIIPTADLHMSSQKRLFFSFKCREKSTKKGGKKRRCAQACLHSSLSGSGIDLSISIISLGWCDAWDILSLSLIFPSFTFTYDLSSLDLKSCSPSSTNRPTVGGADGCQPLPHCSHVVALRFLVSESSSSV